MRRPLVMLIAIAALTTSCYTVTVRPGGGIKDTSEPIYDERQNFFLWGLVGTQHINVKKICNGSEPSQMQTRRSFLDGLLGGLTLGIWAPHSARVWCNKGGSGV
jgi:hypothetical protein